MNSELNKHEKVISQDAHMPGDYAALLGEYSKQELDSIAQLKRFFEWIQGDKDFCTRVECGNFSPEIIERLRRIGITYDLDEVSLLWKNPNTFLQYLENYRDDNQDELPSKIVESLNNYPSLALWTRFIVSKQKLFDTLRKQIVAVPLQPKYDFWRQRRIASARSELGYYGYHINHPVLSFELSDGCSMGCWFCAFAAHKLKGIFDYRENRESFRDIVQICVNLFGKYHAGKAMLYCGTEPHDNPNYLDFLEDYAEITGFPPFTATVVATDKKWFRDLVEFYRRGPYSLLRLSVLSKPILYKIHEMYSPQELRDVDLLMQMKDYPRQKVASGRILADEDGLRSRKNGQYADAVVPQGSIECMSGFLINMAKKTIQLISPCYSCSKWSHGYRIFDKTTFSGAADFLSAIEYLIDCNMPELPPSDRNVCFRDDLICRPGDEGFDLISPNQVHHFKGKEIYGALGKLITGKPLTYNELYDSMMNTYGISPMVSVSVVKKLFDNGFLDEVNPAEK